ncbi:MAG: hypothetical protein LN575_06145 [Rickettsia endosymbiont of Gnoriste bilineata]|nr:hypothetical protein [Rickettsia endosymbiont of Gnoriste bilineata]
MLVQLAASGCCSASLLPEEPPVKSESESDSSSVGDASPELLSGEL